MRLPRAAQIVRPVVRAAAIVTEAGVATVRAAGVAVVAAVSEETAEGANLRE